MRINYTPAQRRLIGLLLFNSVAATAGGLALITNPSMLPAGMLSHSGFPSPYFPGVILFAIVGGSSLIAALAHIKRLAMSSLASLVAGTIMVFWLVGEVASIREVNVLQALFLTTALAIIYLTPAGE